MSREGSGSSTVDKVQGVVQLDGDKVKGISQLVSMPKYYRLCRSNINALTTVVHYLFSEPF